MYGTTGKVMPASSALELSRSGKIVRCADCSKSGPGMVICWLMESKGKVASQQQPSADCCQSSLPAPSKKSRPTRDVKITITALGWISMRTNPFSTPLGQFATASQVTGPLAALTFTPDWVPKTYIGLIGTRNPVPPLQLASPQDYAKTKAMRSLMSCTVVVTIDASSGQPIASRIEAPLLDPGWTPPFDFSLFPPLVLLKLGDPDMQKEGYAPGEQGALSGVYNTRHPNSALFANGTSGAGNGRILADAIMVFRAGEQTDQIGVNSVKAPWHVPWVWNEFALIYQGGTYTLRAVATKFPTTWWYVNGNMVHEQKEAVDTSLPGSFQLPDPRYQVATQSLVIYPVLAAGKPAHGADGQLQPQAQNLPYPGPVNALPYAAPGAAPWQMTVAPQ
jgi:hypothetical protein